MGVPGKGPSRSSRSEACILQVKAQRRGGRDLGPRLPTAPPMNPNTSCEREGLWSSYWLSGGKARVRLGVSTDGGMEKSAVSLVGTWQARSRQSLDKDELTNRSSGGTPPYKGVGRKSFLVPSVDGPCAGSPTGLNQCPAGRERVSSATSLKRLVGCEETS